MPFPDVADSARVSRIAHGKPVVTFAIGLLKGII